MKRDNVLWSDRKRNVLGFPWTFTKYTLTNDRLFIDTGFANSREDEVRLYRIMDMTLTRNLWQKITGTGTIHCDSADQTMKNFDIRNIKNPQEVKEKLSELVDRQRKANRVYTRESMDAHGPGMGPGMPDEMGGYPDLHEPEDMDDND